MVLALGAAVPAVCLDAADSRLDGEHYPFILRLASARTGTTLAGSWLDHAAGIRICGNDSYNCRAAPAYATRSPGILSGLSRTESGLDAKAHEAGLSK